jgi:hypothetical protein
MHVIPQGDQTLLFIEAGCPATLSFLSDVQPLHRGTALL